MKQKLPIASVVTLMTKDFGSQNEFQITNTNQYKNTLMYFKMFGGFNNFNAKTHTNIPPHIKYITLLSLDVSLKV